ncbi:MAG: signal peptide peptidase SppA [bacterium]|nr:signal peptide peptidase SppA [bacterium]
MNDEQSGELLGILRQAVGPYNKYVRGLRWQAWLKTSFAILFLVEAGFLLWPIGRGMRPTNEAQSQVVGMPSSNMDVAYLQKSSTTADMIALVEISGVISEAGRTNMVEDVKLMLQTAREDSRVKAIILKVESPGGGVNASNLIWNEVMKFKKSGKPMVAFFNGIAASGGYYVSVPADKIIATPETWTGSIGVIMQMPNYSGLLKKIGVKYTTIKSGARKDMLSPYKPADKEDANIAQSLVDGAFDRFVQKVADGRNMDEVKVRILADGRIYDSEQALNNGLIDQIGYIEDSFETAKDLAKIKTASLVQYKKKTDVFGDFFAAFSSKPLIDIGQRISTLPPGLYYLWTADR